MDRDPSSDLGNAEFEQKPDLQPGEKVVYQGQFVRVHTPKLTETSLVLPDGRIVIGIPLFQGLLHKRHLLFE